MSGAILGFASVSSLLVTRGEVEGKWRMVEIQLVICLLALMKRVHISMKNVFDNEGAATLFAQRSG